MSQAGASTEQRPRSAASSRPPMAAVPVNAFTGRARVPFNGINIPNQPLRRSEKVVDQQNAQHAAKQLATDPEKPKELPQPKKEKPRATSPPPIITDPSRTLVFSKVGFLGEGGFARVYEAKDARGERHAIKVISKSALKTTKNRTKLFAEIKIHKSLHHPNIVDFEECFEDAENVYMVLELCEGGSLVDLLRRRKRLTETEARFFLIQLIGASEWMHNHQVIHRDLKLGNIFLDASMNVKVGDFGLAALIENPGDRKKTVCGTPNYIAPEVLFDQGNGHSFEVDIWSIGVILYTLVIGKPPFQNKEIKAIYKRIRDNAYEFPSDRPISYDCQSLITSMLTKDPAQRPTLREVLDHPFFTQNEIPAFIPSSAHDIIPTWRNLDTEASKHNLALLRKAVLLEDEVDSPEPSDDTSDSSPSNTQSRANFAPSFAQQERDFQHAVQPGSPISALLQSAKQPLLTVPRESVNLIKRLNAVRDTEPTLAPKRSKTIMRVISEDKLQDKVKVSPRLRTRSDTAKTEIENQKARIVAQIAGALPSSSPTLPDEEVASSKKAPGVVSGPSAGRVAPVPSVKKATSTADMRSTKPNCFISTEATLTEALKCLETGATFTPNTDVDVAKSLPNFLVCWVDYSSKYGMAYVLTDGTIASHFNDSTSLILSPNRKHLEYIVKRGKTGTTFVRKHFTIADRPEELSDKTRLLKHFASYLMANLHGDREFTFVDKDRTNGLDFVQKYLRLKNAILFKTSSDVLQFNFYDHSKLILSHDGLALTHLGKDDVLTRHSLADIISRTLKEDTSEPLDEKLIVKLKYCRQVLREIQKGQIPQFIPGAAPSTSEAQPGGSQKGGAIPDMPDLRLEEIGRGKASGIIGTSTMKTTKTQVR